MPKEQPQAPGTLVLEAPTAVPMSGGRRRGATGLGHLQLAPCRSALQTWQRPAPAALPGPGPAAGADQQEGGGQRCRCQRRAHQVLRARLALRLLRRHLPVSLRAGSPAGLGSASVLPHGAPSRLRGRPHRAGPSGCPPLPAGWGAAGTQALSPLFLQLLGGEGALGQGAPWVSPAWRRSPGGPVLASRGDAPGVAVRGGHTAPLPPGLRAALERAELAELLRPAVSSQHLPSPVLTAAAALRPAAGRCPAAGGTSGVLPGLAGERKGGLGLTRLFLCPFPVHRPPEGVEGARVTQLPSIKLLVEELSGRDAVSAPPGSALPPDAAPAQQRVPRFSPSALLPLPRRRRYAPAAWRGWSSARQR